MMGYNLYGTDIVALRGYADGTLTPTTIVERNGANVAIDDGNMYVKYTMELRYPFLTQSVGHHFWTWLLLKAVMPGRDLRNSIPLV